MKIYSWGSNSHGQLGQGAEADEILLPVPINIAVEPKFITGGGKHTILLTSNNEIFSCGDNSMGQLGKDSSVKLVKTFQQLSFQFKVVKVSCGWDFNIALAENCEVFVWGSNTFGQLGLSVLKVKFLSAPFKIFQNKVVDVAAGLRHSALVTSDGFVFTSGYGRKGQLGFFLNKSLPSVVDKFTLVKGISNCQEISCGENYCIAKTANEEFYSWGNNKYGQLGIDPSTTLYSATPIQIVVFDDSLGKNHLFSGWAHNIILTDKGQIIAWGRNDFGQLGEQRQNTWKPQLLSNIEKIKQVCLGSHHTVVLTENNEVFTWGWNEHGNCGKESCMNIYPETKLEIENPKAEPSFSNETLTTIPVIEEGLDYSAFFELFLLPNRPCIIKNITKNWPCASKWISNKSLNIEYFRTKYDNVDVPISDCGKREYNVQKKCSIKLFDYLKYWEEYKKWPNKLDCLYLKDWHFMKAFPCEEVYRVPSYFASDWLNEYYDNHLQLDDDYRFVYIGPKGSWTPLHADVFTSYSWSVNICGKKKWILFPPGAENNFKDNLGNLIYDIDMSAVNCKEKGKKFQSIEVIQEEDQGLFVPSGWHHQVWNLEDTISVNHNWINGCNIHHVWSSLKENLSTVIKEISDCREMENWMTQCQIVLSASFGFNYQFFYSFLKETAKSRIDALKTNKSLNVYGNWCFGENHLKFDLRRILTVLNWLEKDENFIEIAKIENTLNHALEFLDSMSAFLSSRE